MSRSRLLVTILLALVGLDPSFAVVHADSYAYDAPAPSRSEVDATSMTRGPSSQLSELSAGLVTRSQTAPGTSTTASLSFVATNSTLYRTGSRTDGALTDPSGVSLRDSFTSSVDQVQVFNPGDKVWAIDASKLPAGSVVRDNVPDGHVSVFASPDEIRGALCDDPVLRGSGMKQLDDGSYRIPK